MLWKTKYKCFFCIVNLNSLRFQIFISYKLPVLKIIILVDNVIAVLQSDPHSIM